MKVLLLYGLDSMLYSIVIVGGGAGGLELATRLGRTLGKRKLAKVTLVDANLTHIWKPLLHEVATGSLNSTDNELNYVAQAKWNHFEFQLGRFSGMDRQAKTIELSATVDESGHQLVPARSLKYDDLVIAVGSLSNDFRTKGAAEHCIFLDSPQHALNFHRRLLGEYLSAHAQGDSDNTINIAIVGAGATGVELAAELRHASQQLSAYGLGNIKPDNMRITIIEAGSRVLSALSDKISSDVHKQLLKLGVDIKLSAVVEEVTAEGMRTKDGDFIPASLKVWAAGVRGPKFLTELDGLVSNRVNQLVVRTTLQTTLDDDVFALGDCAACPLAEGSETNVPPRAQSAHQQASFLSKALALKIQGKPLPSYMYRDYGSLVSLSQYSAVGNIMGGFMRTVNVEGWMARMFYISLYRMHQVVLYGVFRTALIMLSDRIGRRTHPRMKLH